MTRSPTQRANAHPHVLVFAKEPAPGNVKTRLSPPLSPGQAADLASAALADTLHAVLKSRASRRVIALEGNPGPWLPPGFEVIPQRGDGQAERLDAAWRDSAGPGLQIGMDTPQVSAELLDSCLADLDAPGHTAVLGLAEDGGWWAIGFTRGWQEHPFDGVPMSTPTTGVRQLERLYQLRHRVGLLPVLRDVDHLGDCDAVARAAPGTAFAAAWRRTCELSA